MGRLPIAGLCELVLEVEDMERAVDFWHGTLGIPIVEQWAPDDAEPSKEQATQDGVWATWLYIGGNTRLGLWLKRDFTLEERTVKNLPVTKWDSLYDEGGEHVHCAFYVEKDRFEDTLNVLREADIAVKIREWDEQETSNDKEYSAYFKDTEQNVIELYTKNMDEAYEDFSGPPQRVVREVGN
ncbi:VOC family protein [Exiguobacterium oxidotolerans]|uniref:Glyoxalase n=1 Tax=Exiguobacterium oxidotolerans TaxID=223958 RepID=A0A653IBN6_9BACL|nr:VOC family protein [Exiguobacterium oxidotolerans]VWX36435.1 Glyoxalase [Exiguobacterium oxidotolerans]